MAGERTLPGLGLTGFWNEGSGGWKTGMDDNLRILSAVAGGAIKSRVSTLPGTPVQGDMHILTGAGPDTQKVIVRDNSTWVYLTPQEGWQFWVRDENVTVVFDGTNWITPFLQAQTRIIAGGFVETPTANETLLLYTAAETIEFSAAFLGAKAQIGINPTSLFTMDVIKNPTFTGTQITGGTSLGTIQFSTTGTVTFATTGSSPKTLANSETLGIRAPGTADSTAACASFTLRGVVPT